MEDDGTSPTVGRYRRFRTLATLAVSGVVGIMLTADALAQAETMKALAERSAIVVEGEVVRVNASMEPLQPASPQTVVIRISRMHAGTEIAGDQQGHTATVVLSGATSAMKVGTKALFFGNPRFVGKSLTIADEGELLASAAKAEVDVGLQARRDQPLRERIAAASSIFLGKVEEERPLSAAADQPSSSREPPSEHDPEWHVASVRVLAALKGTDPGALVNILFPASADIVWFNARKLKPGQEGVFLPHAPNKDDMRLIGSPGVAKFLATQPAEVISEPFDVLPASDEARVRTLLAASR
jgi:hypothetical protein